MVDKKHFSIEMNTQEAKKLFQVILYSKESDFADVSPLGSFFMKDGLIHNIAVGVYLLGGYYIFISEIISNITDAEEGERVFAILVSHLKTHALFAIDAETIKVEKGSGKVAHISTHEGERLFTLYNRLSQTTDHKNIIFMCSEAIGSSPKDEECHLLHENDFDYFYRKINQLLSITTELAIALFGVEKKMPPEKTFFLECSERINAVLQHIDHLDHFIEKQYLPSKLTDPQKEHEEDSDQARKEKLRSVIEVTDHFDVSFDDVGGQEKAKHDLLDIVYTLKYPDVLKKYGIPGVKGVLLYGPPGNGKTYMMKALVREIDDCKFFHVQTSDIFIKWVGESARNIRLVFDIAREHTPCILLLDEIDSLASTRDDGHESSRQVVATILEQLDGLRSVEGVIVVGATNRRDDVDPAIRRPGRFDKEVEVGTLSQEGKQDVFKIHIKKVEKTKGMDQDMFSSDIDLSRVVAETYNDMSGAAIEQVIKRSVLSKATQEIENKTPTLPITTSDLLEEIRKYTEEKGKKSRTVGFSSI